MHRQLLGKLMAPTPPLEEVWWKLVKEMVWGIGVREGRGRKRGVGVEGRRVGREEERRVGSK
jgi:hypothetical protein